MRTVLKAVKDCDLVLVFCWVVLQDGNGPGLSGILLLWE